MTSASMSPSRAFFTEGCFKISRSVAPSPPPAMKNLFRFRVRQHRRMHQQFVVDKFIDLAGLNLAVQHQHFTESRAFHYLQTSGIWSCRNISCPQMRAAAINADLLRQKTTSKIQFPFISYPFAFCLEAIIPRSIRMMEWVLGFNFADDDFWRLFPVWTRGAAGENIRAGIAGVPARCALSGGIPQ